MNTFEDIKHIDENGVEYWTARELFPLLGYSTWQAFEEVVQRAQRTAIHSGQKIENHFSQLTKLAEVGSNKNRREIKDWKLDRYACYLIAQNGDSRIKQIALAQTYFAIQTRKQELFEQSDEIDKRIFIRAIKNIGGELPENLKPEKHIRELKKEAKLVSGIKLKANKKKLH